MKNLSRWLLTVFTLTLLLCRALIRIDPGADLEYRIPFVRFIVFALINAVLGVCIGILVRANTKYANKYIVLSVAFVLVSAIPFLYYTVPWFPFLDVSANLFKVWETALLLSGTFAILAIKARLTSRDLDQDIPEDAF